jgi:hypothetical protein
MMARTELSTGTRMQSQSAQERGPPRRAQSSKRHGPVRISSPTRNLLWIIHALVLFPRHGDPSTACRGIP